jgi:hypothetical protein
MAQDPAASEILRRFLTADDLLGGRPENVRFVIDFGERSLPESRKYSHLFDRVEALVLPDRKKAAEREAARNAEAMERDADAKTTHDHESALDRWWLLFRSRQDMLRAIRALPRYIVCGRVTKRPIFEFVDSAVNPNDALMVFPFADDYSFGILQSAFHWIWFVNRCSTLKGDPRYTSNTVFDTFPWPQAPKARDIDLVAKAAISLRNTRRFLLKDSNQTLRALYRELEKPGKHPLKEAHAELDLATRNAYGFSPKADMLKSLLDLNRALAGKEPSNVVGPGAPRSVKQPEQLISPDSFRLPPLARG